MAEASGDNGKQRRSGRRRVNLIAAVAHPVRRQILRLAHDSDEPVEPSQVALELGAPAGSVAYHTTVLEQLGGLEPAGDEGLRGAIEGDWPLEALIEEDCEADDEAK